MITICKTDNPINLCSRCSRRYDNAPPGDINWHKIHDYNEDGHSSICTGFLMQIDPPPIYGLGDYTECPKSRFDKVMPNRVCTDGNRSVHFSIKALEIGIKAGDNYALLVFGNFFKAKKFYENLCENF